MIFPGSGTPIYRQIVDQVRLAVATGTLTAGDAMPSVRSLAERLLEALDPDAVRNHRQRRSAEGRRVQ